MNNKDFNIEIRRRTNRLFGEIFKISQNNNTNSLSQPLVKQLIRSSSSISANWEAAIFARSKKEMFSKICIVVEECNETLRWIEMLLSIGCFTQEEIKHNKEGYEELQRIFISMKKKLRS